MMKRIASVFVMNRLIMTESDLQEMVTFSVPGDPAPWCVYTKRGKEPLSHQKMRSYQTDVQGHAKSAMNGRDPHEGPVEVVFFCSINGFERWDVTNLQKAAEDALKGIVMKDDRQVVYVNSIKDLSGPPRTEVWCWLRE